jgi:DnaA-homolog protein
MSVVNSGQLALGLGLDDDARFENFLVSAENQQLLDYLQADCDEQFVYIWGKGSPGLTHILQAACHKSTAEDSMVEESTMATSGALYLPLKEKRQLSPEILQGVSSLSLVCIDDIDEIAGDESWESALFTAFNSIKESRARLIIAGKTAPKNLAIDLPDLHSRLQSGLILQLKELDDKGKLLALQLRAKQRGIELPDAVAEFILLRAQRSLLALMGILDKLDQSSLEQKRKLSIPLVKSTLGW